MESSNTDLTVVTSHGSTLSDASAVELAAAQALPKNNSAAKDQERIKQIGEWPTLSEATSIATASSSKERVVTSADGGTDNPSVREPAAR